MSVTTHAVPVPVYLTPFVIVRDRDRESGRTGWRARWVSSTKREIQRSLDASPIYDTKARVRSHMANVYADIMEVKAGEE